MLVSHVYANRARGFNIFLPARARRVYTTRDHADVNIIIMRCACFSVESSNLEPQQMYKNTLQIPNGMVLKPMTKIWPHNDLTSKR